MSDATRTSGQVTADLYLEVQSFYARQMPLLETRKIEDFAGTFTEGATFGYVGGWEPTSGRAALTEGLSRSIPALYGSSTIRHWFENRVVEAADDGSLRVTQTSIVSVTDENGDVTWEPSCTVEDVLVRVDGVLHVSERLIAHDLTDPMRYWARFQGGRSEAA